jgi:hypothetical protein
VCVTHGLRLYYKPLYVLRPAQARRYMPDIFVHGSSITVSTSPGARVACTIKRKAYCTISSCSRLSNLGSNFGRIGASSLGSKSFALRRHAPRDTVGLIKPVSVQTKRSLPTTRPIS